MIKTDRAVISAVLKLTDNYHDEIMLGSNPTSLLLIRNYRDILKSVPLNISEEDAEESVQRLISSGLLRFGSKWSGGYSFCMTSRLKHRHQFWLDTFTKTYIGGFISGVSVTVASGLLLHFFTRLF